MTNIADQRVGVKWSRLGLVDALLSPDTGAAALWNCELVRDDEEFCLLKNVGMNRGVRIEYGKNLLGVECSIDDSSVVTKYIPVGQTAKGKDLLLTGGTYYTDHGTIVLPDGQYWVDSDRAGRLPLRESGSAGPEIERQGKKHFIYSGSQRPRGAH